MTSILSLITHATHELTTLFSTSAPPLADILTANSSFSTSASPLANNPVIFIAGGTSGIGLALLKACAKHTNNPRIYFTGRNATAAEKIVDEVKQGNPDAQLIFLQADLTLLSNVHDLAHRFHTTELQHLKSSSQVKLHLLSLSVGALDLDLTPTSESLPPSFAARHYARHLLTTLLLPALTLASGKVLNIEAAGYESPDFDADDIALSKAPHTTGTAVKLIFQQQVTAASLMAESFALRYGGGEGGVQFLHVYPGVVKSGLMRELPGVWGVLARWVVEPVLKWGVYMDPGEVGERFFWILTGGVEMGACWLGNWAGARCDWREKGFGGVEGEAWEVKRREWREKMEGDLVETWGRVLGDKWKGWPC